MVSNPIMIPERTLSLIESADNQCYVSIASFWEIAIKYSLGRLDIQNSIDASFKSILTSGIEILPISADHALIVITLPHHHGDPFDRMIIAQAQFENLIIYG